MSHSILIVDDHAGFRRVARAVLEADGFAVVGEAADGAGALVEVARLRPDIVLLDIQLPDQDGFAVAQQLAARSWRPTVILISSRDRTSYEPQLKTAHTRGFIAKSHLSGAAVAALLE